MSLNNLNARAELLMEMNQGVPSFDARRVLNPTYGLKEMRSRHREIVRLAVQGFKAQEIAEYLDIHKQTVSNVINNPLVLRQIKILQDARDAKASEVTTLDKLRPDAVQALEDLVNDNDEKTKAVRLGAAKEILDRTDGKPIQRHDIQKTSIILEQIQILKDRARNAGVLPKAGDGDVDELEEVVDAEVITREEPTPEAVV